MTHTNLSLPDSDPVAHRLEALAGDGVVGAERVLRERLDEPACARPQDYLNCLKHGELALSVDVDSLRFVVRHAGPDCYEQIAVREGIVETGPVERRANDIRQKVNHRGGTLVESSTVQHLYAEAERGGGWV